MQQPYLMVINKLKVFHDGQDTVKPPVHELVLLFIKGGLLVQFASHRFELIMISFNIGAAVV